MVAWRRGLGIGIVVFLSVVVCRVGRAQGLRPEVQRDLLMIKLDKQVEAEQHGEVLETVAALRAMVVTAPALDYAEGQALNAMGRYQEARECLFRYVNNKAGSGSKRYAKARQILLELQQKIVDGTLIVEVMPPGATVYLGKWPLSADECAAGVKRHRGVYAVRAEFDGKTLEEEAKVTAGETTTVRLDFAVGISSSWAVRRNGIGMEFVAIPPGAFLQGSPEDEPKRGSDETRHMVVITKGFWLGKYEVTQEEWVTVMGNNPSDSKGPCRPVENVSWDDCQEFLKKLNGRERNATYRLPTEAEWEYACRAGSTESRYGDLSGIGWYAGNSDSATHDVGLKRANAWGLYDMLGNVGEWCQDWYGDYPKGTVTDPTGASSGSGRVLRGGSWNGLAGLCRAADRYGYVPVNRHHILGFRVVGVFQRTP